MYFTKSRPVAAAAAIVPGLVLPIGCRAQVGETNNLRALPAHAALAATPVTPGTSGGMVDAGAPFGKLRLVDEIDCGAPTGTRAFAEMPVGVSRVETVLGKQCRVLPNTGEAKYFAYRIGQGKGLKPGAAYVLSVDFPEDKSRSMFLVNRGAEMVRGVRTGQALGDVIWSYTNNNNESLRIPLSGKYRAWKALFFLHDRFRDIGLASEKAGEEDKPRSGDIAQGFWVAVAQSKADNDPVSAGAAVSRIRLFEVTDVAKLTVPLRLPPAALPRRHLFWREEMADGVVLDKEAERGVINPTNWFEYKIRLMQFLGMNTYTKDLLEFGHNQGWDSGPTNDWFNASSQPEMWGNTLAMLRKYRVDVLPYYEYAGSVGQKGVGTAKRAMPLSGASAYTHISWTEGHNLDITDPEALTDATRLLDATIVRYKDTVPFVGAWFRTRPSMWPIGFADPTLARFATEANGGQTITRDHLKADPALLQKYYAWWFGKRRDFLVALRDHLRAKGIAGADVLFTADASEPGIPLLGPHTIVTDDPALWTPVLQQPAFQNKMTVTAFDEVVRGNKQLEALTAPPTTWGEWEWQHSLPQSDPQRYRDTEGVLLTYSFNRAYSVSSPKGFDAFRTRSGLATILHYPLNEHSMEKSLGYVASDVEYAGPYCMLSEARAVAYGDPRYLGYLAASSFNRGFPEYVRAFNAAFLALPALPSHRLPTASTAPEIVVRAIPTKGQGTYLAVVNVGFNSKKTIITLPVGGKVADAATGKALAAPGGKLRLALYPCELRSLLIR